MFKLVVLSALVAVAVAKPSLYHGAVEVVAPSYVVPAAVSSTYRKDIISKPAAVTYAALPAYAYAAPVVAKTVAPEPVAVVAKNVIAPAAVSHTYREDTISKPAAVTYAAVPAYAYAAPVVAKTVAPEPVAVAAPVVAKTVVAPGAVSHTYREDVISKPSAVAYATPSVEVAAPVVQQAVAYAAPAAVSSSYRTDVASSPVLAKTIVSPAAYTYAAHVPATYAYGVQSPAVHAW